MFGCSGGSGIVRNDKKKYCLLPSQPYDGKKISLDVLRHVQRDVTKEGSRTKRKVRKKQKIELGSEHYYYPAKSCQGKSHDRTPECWSENGRNTMQN